MFTPVRLGKTGRVPAIGLADFSVTMWLKFDAGAFILRTPSWRIVQDADGSGYGHLNAILAPRCDFHTYEMISRKVGTAATFVRCSGNIFWYLNDAFDNEDHGTEYDLPESEYESNGVVVLWPRALTPKEVREIVKAGS